MPLPEKSKVLRPLLKKAEHPFDEKQEAEDLIERITTKIAGDPLPNCVTAKYYATESSSDEWKNILNRFTTSVKMRPDGTVVALAQDGSWSELRSNGTIISYFGDGTIKSFRVGPQAQIEQQPAEKQQS